MIFKLREFKPSFGVSLPEIVKYLAVELASSLRELRQGLTKLNFSDNFEGWIEEVEIPATSEKKITNRLGSIPNYRLILRSNSDSIVDGDTAWSTEFVYLKNTSASTATLTVAFIK